MKSIQSRKIVFAGGGTAGHVEPALAVARAWLRKHPADSCLFLGTPDGLENSLVPVAGFELLTIPKVVMPRTFGVDLFLLPARLARAGFSARKYIAGADLLIGFGGYLAASAYLAARSLRIPIVIHEANSTVGWANRLGAKFTNSLAITHPVPSGDFAKAKVTGLPLREDVRSTVLSVGENWREARNRAKRKLGWGLAEPAVLILGGSQGSAYINSHIAAALPELVKKKIHILHSVGSRNAMPADSAYYTPVAYITDMATAYLAADLVIARSGAVTCAEFGALGRMALFIPLPIGNGEQARNADHLVEAGRARLIAQQDFSSDWLLENIDQLLSASGQVPLAGLRDDINSEESIVNLMESAIDEKCE